MKVRRKIYEGLIAQCEALAAALHEEKSKRQLWTRKYYTLLLGIESARREADGGTDAAPSRFGSDVNGLLALPSVGANRAPSNGHAPAPTLRAKVATVSEAEPAYTPPKIASPALSAGIDSAGFYTSHSLNTLEAFGALPCRTVANAYCDAPPTPSLNGEPTRPVLSGGDVPASPLPPVGVISNAFSRNAREPLSLDTTIINSAV